MNRRHHSAQVARRQFLHAGLSAPFVAGSLISPCHGADDSRPPIIDMHMHAGFWGAGRKEFTTGMIAPSSAREYIDQTVNYLHKFNIKAVVGDTMENGERLKERAPERVVLATGFNDPKLVPPEKLRQLAKAGKIHAIAEVGTQYQGISPDSEILEPYFAMAEEEEIPFGLHMGPGPPNGPHRGFPKYRASLSNPLLLEDVLVKHPKLRIWVMHAGWPMLDEMINLLYSHHQVYVDIGVINWGIPRAEFYHYLRRIVKAGFGKRVMFGSDQMTWPEAIPRAIEAIELAPFLNDSEKRDIMHDNAARFMRWQGDGA